MKNTVKTIAANSPNKKGEFVSKISDQTRGESNRLRGYLLDHINRPEYQTRFSWRTDHVAMWDNRCMNRITIVNDKRSTS